MRTAARLPWIDVLKGLGITSVVAGHVFDGSGRDAIFLFHMPLFFFVSGYLFRPNVNRWALAGGKARQLLVPYASFLLVLGIPLLASAYVDGTLVKTAAKLIVGGQMLTGPLGVFWFLTCLYATMLVANEALLRKATVPAVLTCLVVSYANSWLAPAAWLPLNINVVPAAVPFFLLGHLVRFTQPRWVTPVSLVGNVIAAALISVDYPIAYDMKYAMYGIPLLSLTLAACCIMSTCELAKRVAGVRPLSGLFERLGRLSLGIMFLHQPINFAMRAAFPGTARVTVFAVALGASFAVAELLDRREWSRRCFLGVRTERGLPRSISPDAVADR